VTDWFESLTNPTISVPPLPILIVRTTVAKHRVRARILTSQQSRLVFKELLILPVDSCGIILEH
jgi:hypothetical protein